MEIDIQLFILVHASFGGIALLSGLFAIFSKKGGKLHKRSGLVFYYTMLASTLSSLVIACLPNHESAFLFSVGIFSTYFLLTGKRALNYAKTNFNPFWDKVIAWVMIGTGLVMVFLELILKGSFNIILGVFGTVGIYFAVKDLLLFRNVEKRIEKRLTNHLGKMMGAYIATTTAFIVVNDVFPTIYNWLAPGLIGGIIISYWSYKLKKKETRS